MLQILGAFLQSSLMAIFYLIIIILGTFASKILSVAPLRLRFLM